MVLKIATHNSPLPVNYFESKCSGFRAILDIDQIDKHGGRRLGFNLQNLDVEQGGQHLSQVGRLVDKMFAVTFYLSCIKQFQYPRHVAAFHCFKILVHQAIRGVLWR